MVDINPTYASSVNMKLSAAKKDTNDEEQPISSHEES
jgi:hypothetical protein